MLGADFMVTKGTKGEKLGVRIDEELLRGLDALRRDEPGLPNRAEMVRRLIARAVEAAAKAKAK